MVLISNAHTVGAIVVDDEAPLKYITRMAFAHDHVAKHVKVQAHQIGICASCGTWICHVNSSLGQHGCKSVWMCLVA